MFSTFWPISLNRMSWVGKSYLDARQMVFHDARAKIRVQAYVKDVSPKATYVHYFIHRFLHRLALCAKVLPSYLMSCLNKIIKIVNFIRTSVLNTRLFARLCKDVDCDHKCLLFHTEKKRNLVEAE